MSHITETAILDLLTGKGTTFAGIDYVTEVKTAAKHKDIKILKSVTANVQLFRTISEYAEVYKTAVIKSANRIEGQEILDFTPSDTWFSHDDDCFSIVHHKQTGKPYLYAIFNGAKSEFTIDGAPASREMVAEYLTPSEAKRLLDDNPVIHNVKNDIMHTVQCRTIGIENLRAIRACKSELV